MRHSQPSDLHGVLLVDKAPAMTSHDVVAVVRKRLAIKKVGHCGTLDPMATGLLIVVVGRATKIQDLLMAEDKEYEGTIRLGTSTSTQDREGQMIQQRPVPELSLSEVEQAFARFAGGFYQMPPMVSAIKKDGVPLYKLARQGKEIEREPRLVHVYHHAIARIALPEIDFRVLCSKGFYVRTYAHDIGEHLGCCGHLSALRRTRSGRFDLSRAITFARVKEGPREDIEAALISLPEVSRLRGV
ncbi:MAG: tRNA pseudouridine(55) synthase TruB [Verrucomicrobiales bacterium]